MRRCERSGLKCEGPKDITFVEATIVKSRRTKKPTAGDPIRGGGGPVSVSHPPSVNQLELYICCSQKHIRRGGAIDLVLQRTHISEIAVTGGQIFHPAILGFGAIILGSKHGHAAITNRGYVLHGTALKRLNTALSEPGCYMRDDVLLSVSTMAILECVIPSGSRNYLSHMIGLERLLQLRGPVACSPISFEVYKSVRHMIIFASLCTGKPSILAGDTWKAALRSHCSDDDLPEQDLFDVLADCTVLSCRRDKMLADWHLFSKESCLQERDSIKENALDLFAQLQDWRQRWEADASNFMSTFETGSVTDKPPPEPCAQAPARYPPNITFLSFQKISAATMWMCYNTTMIHVFRILASLPLENSGLEDSSDSIQMPLSISEPTRNTYASAERLAALEICRCIPYYSGQIARTDADLSPIPHWAVMTARATLCRNEATKGTWIMDLLGATNPDIVANGVWIDQNR
ncbi:hypothetical protein ABW21_db0205355 [Orbilia brochopaga]|nr:hypothetical protein ABW21_db0205355 [Drechslerella brochopaga]